ncbi:MAG: hypothetical protein AB4062_17350 [Crocosphaera sp.]
MGFKHFNFERFPGQFLLISLIIIYYIIGLYLMQQTSVTSDESAYIGAAYAYTQGLGLNQEHPLFFKLINSLIINLFFPTYNLDVPSINIISGEENLEARLAAFNLGYSLLMENANQFKQLLFSLRLPYLIFNNFILIWLYLYTFIFNKIPSRISLVFALLYVFSPSFYSHNFLIAFDVSTSLYGVLSILSLMIIYDENINKNSNDVEIHFFLFNIIIFITINAKFSNLILILITTITYIFICYYLLKQKRRKTLNRFFLLSIISIILQLLSIILMYSWAFRSLPEQSLINNFIVYIQGIQMNLSTAGGIREPYWKGQFASITSLQYLSKMFWFKENPGLLILGIYLFCLVLYKLKNFQKINFRINRKNLPLILLATAYPLIYFWLIKDSRFIIGYRYFYPIIIFIYLLIASLTIFLKHKWQKYVLLAGLTIYIYLGIVGIPQSLSYVNPLWSQPKWQLTDDSTTNWGQETEQVVQYLLNNKLLPEDNNNVITYQLFGVNIGFVQYLDLLSQTQAYPINIQSYYAPSRFNPETETIVNLPHKYLLIDSTVKQKIYAHKDKNAIAAKNWIFLTKNQPIYSRNDIIFIYKLN